MRSNSPEILTQAEVPLGRDEGMNQKIALIALGVVVTGCATPSFYRPTPLPPPKPESAWSHWGDLRDGGHKDTILRVMGPPVEAARSASGEEFMFWQNGCGLRLRNDRIAGRSCGDDSHDWSKIGEGTSLTEVRYWVGISKDFELVNGGKIYYYQPDTYTRCLLGISDKSKSVVARKCETDTAGRALADMQQQSLELQLQSEQRRARAERARAIQDAFKQPQRTNCTTSMLGGTAYTNCSSY